MKTSEKDWDEACAFLQRFLGGDRGFTSEDALAGVARLKDMQGQLRDSDMRRQSRLLARSVREKLKLNGARFEWATAD
jgi:hypothetical protein